MARISNSTEVFVYNLVSIICHVLIKADGRLGVVADGQLRSGDGLLIE